MESGVVPRKIKVSITVPIYKSGSPSELTNYRPISCLPILNKIIEKMVTKQLNEYLNTNNLLNKHQYGFQFYKSTSHALLHAIDFIFKAFSNNELVLLVFLDLRKAFDLCPNLMNLGRVSNPPKTSFK